MIRKTCNRCKIEKPSTEFYTRMNGRYLKAYCKDCEKHKARAYDNLESHKEYFNKLTAIRERKELERKERFDELMNMEFNDCYREARKVLKRHIKKREGGECQCCGKKAETLLPVIPAARNSLLYIDIDNQALLCYSCKDKWNSNPKDNFFRYITKHPKKYQRLLRVNKQQPSISQSELARMIVHYTIK